MHLGPSGCHTKIGGKRAELVQKFMPRSRVGIFRNKRTRSIPLDPQTDVLVRFVLFGCFLGRLVALRNSVQNGPKKCKSSCHEVASEFFATNAPGPPHWTLNLFFIAFHTNWMHLGPFGCIRKLGAKRAELVRKFVT